MSAMGKPIHTRVCIPFKPMVASLLAFAVTAGLAHIWFGGGPRHYLAINGVALGIALLAIAFLPPSERPRSALLASASAVAILWAPLAIGPETEGISRWIALGPVRLHSGMLAVPVLLALLFHVGERTRIVIISASAAALAMQPDRASALALAGGVAAIAIADGGRASRVATGVSLAALIATMANPDPLAPVPFVEHVLQDAWRANAWAGILLTVVLSAALILPVLADRAFAPVAAAMAGFAIASLLGPYPTPLIGAGASAILGFGLCVALTPRRTD